jgi:23S rRNA (uracil1939-C5)-methyltransferase
MPQELHTARGRQGMTIEVEVTAMTFGPYALARASDGRTVMVPNAAPGDRLEVSVTAHRRDYDLARIERILKAGPARREPPCPFLPRCGGCDWQQLDYAAQLRAKSGIIASTLGRSLNIELATDALVVPAPSEFAYRSRIRLKADSEGRLGFFERGSNRLVPIDRCIVAVPEIVLPHEIATAIGNALGEMELVGAEGREVGVAYLRRPLKRAEMERMGAAMDKNPALRGLIVHEPARRYVLGDGEIRLEIEPGLELRADADLFSQVNQEQNRAMVAAVMEMAGAREGVEILDLFCGAGNLSLPAARRGAKVRGIDSDALAVAAAERNARRLGVSTARFIAMDAAQGLQFLARARYRPEVVILDPPRTGAAELMEPLTRLGPRHIIYVSCDITTLARDLHAVVSGRYRVRTVRAFDFFPNTHHVETVVHALLT